MCFWTFLEHEKRPEANEYAAKLAINQRGTYEGDVEVLGSKDAELPHILLLKQFGGSRWGNCGLEGSLLRTSRGPIELGKEPEATDILKLGHFVVVFWVEQVVRKWCGGAEQRSSLKTLHLDLLKVF